MSILSLVKTLNKLGGLNLHVSGRARIFLVLAVLCIPGALMFGVLAQPWVNPKWMFLDFLTAAEFSDDCCHVYYGFISNIGIFLWVATAAICLFSAIIFLKWRRAKALFRFAVTAGLFSAWLALDDAFLLHEIVLPKLGVPQFTVLATYVILAFSYLVASWRVVLSSEYWIMGIGVGAVAISIGVDQIVHSLDSTIVIIEDTAKFFGVSCWFAFHLVTLVVAFYNHEAHPERVQ